MPYQVVLKHCEYCLEGEESAPIQCSICGETSYLCLGCIDERVYSSGNFICGPACYKEMQRPGVID